ncbi:MAG TPA: hypothetical protein VF635_03995 [Propionibacteriaceae bacterium]
MTRPDDDFDEKTSLAAVYCRPPERVTSPGAAVGDTDPSAFLTKVRSISRQPSSALAAASLNRTGPAAISELIVPSAFTHERDVSDRCDNTSTRCPEARAVTLADTASGRTSPAPVVSVHRFATGGASGAAVGAAVATRSGFGAIVAASTTANPRATGRQPNDWARSAGEGGIRTSIF